MFRGLKPPPNVVLKGVFSTKMEIALVYDVADGGCHMFVEWLAMFHMSGVTLR